MLYSPMESATNHRQFQRFREKVKARLLEINLKKLVSANFYGDCPGKRGPKAPKPRKGHVSLRSLVFFCVV